VMALKIGVGARYALNVVSDGAVRRHDIDSAYS